MLMDGDHLGRIAYETIRQLGDMDKPVFLDSYIDETTEVGDVGHDTGQYLPFFQILDMPPDRWLQSPQRWLSAR